MWRVLVEAIPDGERPKGMRTRQTLLEPYGDEQPCG